MARRKKKADQLPLVGPPTPGAPVIDRGRMARVYDSATRGTRVHYREWKSLGALVDWIDHQEHELAAGNRHSIINGADFCKDSWETAMEKARKGEPKTVAMIAQLSERLEKHLSRATRYGFESRFDVAGGEIDMGRYFGGEPECMIDHPPAMVEDHAQTVRLVSSAMASGSIGQDAMAMRGAIAVAMVDAFAHLNIPVEVWSDITIGSTPNWATASQAATWRVRVKAADEPLDMSAVQFALMNPAMLRRIGFCLLELEPEELRGSLGCPDGAYGFPLDVDEDPRAWTDGRPPSIVVPAMVSHQPWTKTPEAAAAYLIDLVKKAGIGDLSIQA